MRPLDKVVALLEGRNTRPCISMWKHFPLVDRIPRQFVQKTLAFQETHNWAFVKLCYNGLYSIEDWGSIIKWPGKEDETGFVADYFIKKSKDWDRLQPLSVQEDALAREIAVTKEVVNAMKGRVPVLGTVFSPLTTACKMSGQIILDHIRGNSQSLTKALEVITHTTREFAGELVKAGVDGIFFATQMGTTDLLTVEEYGAFGIPYDLSVLDVIQGKTWFNVLHIHGSRPMLAELKNYPVQGINWHDRRVAANLTLARQITDKVLIGGIDEHGVMAHGDERVLRAHIREAVEQEGGARLILGPGCVVPLKIPEEKLIMVKKIVEEL